MPRVDPEDDDLDRYVIWRYRYDAERNERRNCVVAAFDNEAEFLAYITALGRSLNAERIAGTAEAVENVNGAHKRPGDDARSREARIASRRRTRHMR